MNLAYAAWLLAATLMALLTAGVAWHRRSAPGAFPLVLLLLALAEWTFTYALHWLVAVPGERRGWLDATFVGVSLAPVFVLLMTLELTGRSLNRAARAALFGVPLVTVLLLLAGDPQGLLFGVRPLDAHNLLQGGPWFRVVALYGYALLVLSAALLIHFSWRSPPLYRRQATLLLAGLVLPWAVNVVSVLGARPFPDLDLTPVLFLLTALVFLWGIVGLKLFDVLPVARHLLVEQMAEGVMVLDERGRVVDLNPAARRLSRWSGPSPLGQPVDVVFANWSHVLERYRGVQQAHAELLLDGNVFLDLQISPLYDGQGRLRGRLVVWRDMTARREAETRLRQAHAELQARLSEIEQLQLALQEKSLRDPLTGLHNRRFLQTALEEAQGRAAASAQPFSLVIVDIDHFKQINDRVGHGGGDAVLHSVARLLEAHRGAGETLCRYGGEEFVLVLPDTPLEVALTRAEAYRTALEGQVVMYGGQALRCTASLGVATFPTHGTAAEAVLVAADEALYTAKRQGRNRVAAPPAAAPLS